MLLIDGVRYNLWVPKEEKQLEEIVKEHSKEIFGDNSVYFDLKQKLTSKAGIVSIPDGYVISFSKPFEWYIIEGELSSHPLHEHITNQLNKFMIGIRNPSTQRELVDTLYDGIDSNKQLRASIESLISSPEIKGVLYDLISKIPKIVVVIEERGDEVREACDGLKVEPIVVEFKTYVRENAENVHAHLFEPLYVSKEIFEEPEIKRVIKVMPSKMPKALEEILAVVELMDQGTLYKEAVKTVAKQRNIDESTIRDKCTRILNLNTEQFVEIVKDRPRLVSLLQQRFPNYNI